MTGHGTGSNLNDMYQVKELTNAVKRVQNKMGYADGFGVPVRED